MKCEYKFFEYQVEFFSQLPNLDDSTKSYILEKLDYVNRKSNTKLTYGIFDPNLSIDGRLALLNKMLVSLIFLNGEPVAFSYQYILEESLNSSPVLHQGLIVSHRNPGRDITMMNKIACKFYYEQNKPFYTTCLAAAPFAIGEVARFFSNVWPSPYNSCQKKPTLPEYKNIAQLCFDRYIKEFFPYPENLDLDQKRFVVTSKALEMGFEVDLRKMQRDDDLVVNLFSMFWLDYAKQEIILQVGQFDETAYNKLEKTLAELNIQFKKV